MKNLPADVFDVVLREEAVVSHVRVETGFDVSEERAGNDRIVSGQLLMGDISNDVDDSDISNETKGAYRVPCKNFKVVAKFDPNSGRLEFTNKDVAHSGKTKCLRIQVFKGQSDWIILRLIQVETTK